MLKNISWDTKDKIKISLLIFLAVEGKMLFETVEMGLIRTPVILIALAAGAAFTLFLLFNITEKSVKSLSAQGVFVALTVIFALGALITYKFVSKETLLVLLLASVMAICAKKLYLLPVAVAFGVVTVFNVFGEIHDFIGLSCIPAVIGISCVCLSSEIKQSSVWKKIVFAVLELALTALAVKSFYNRRFTVSLASLFSHVWDTIGAFIAALIFVALIVYSVVNSKNIIEIFGYTAVASFGIVTMAMESVHALSSAMTMFMVLASVSKEGSSADIAAEEALKSIASLSKKSKKRKA